MKNTVGSQLIRTLEAHGVRHVFGIPGVHNLELYRGLAASGIRHVTGRHEQGLGFMAEGYARVSGRPGVCFTITGPGLTNIATALGQAFSESQPLLVIASGERESEHGSGRGFLHEMADQRGVAARVCGSSRRITRAEELPGAVAEAFESFATRRPRPAYIEVPRDLLAMELPQAQAMPAAGGAAPASGGGRVIVLSASARSALQQAASQLRVARRVVLMVGGGAVHAPDLVRKLAEKLGAPTLMTVNARGLLPPGHPLGVSASPSLAAARRMLKEAELVLAVGCEFGPTDFDMYGDGGFPALGAVIRVDIDPAQLPRGATPRIAVEADAAKALEELLGMDLGPVREDWGRQEAARTNREALAELSPAMRREVAVLEALRDGLPGACLVGDSTQPVYAGNLYFEAARPRSWFNSGMGFGTLGYALPASTGAALGAGDRPVACITGDGGVQFTLGELAVPREAGTWQLILVWNNHGYREIRNSMVAVDIEPEGVNVQPPDFAALAAAYGYAYQRVDALEPLRAALGAFAARRQVLVLEVRAEAFE